MLNTLLESRAQRARRARGAAVSVVAHATLIALAVVATGSATDAPPAESGQHVTWVPTPPSRAPAPPVARRPPGDGRASRTPSPVDAPSLPPIGDIADVPAVTLPGVDPLDDRAEFGRGGLAAPGGPGDAADGGLGSGDGPLTEGTVDRAVLPIPGTGAPRYPELLRASGVEGRVVARFVVDTVGRVEPGSLVVRETTDEQFAAAVRAALPAMRFRPAEAGGRRVRQLVEQTFEFRLGR